MALLEVTNLGISFGGLQAVAGFDLTVETGHLYGLIGPNGAGKTTAFNMLTGMGRTSPGRARSISPKPGLPEPFRTSAFSG